MAALSTWLAPAIRRARVQQELSQEALAERAALHRTYISLVERGRRNLTVDALDRIAAALGSRGSQLLAEAERERGRSAVKRRRP